MIPSLFAQVSYFGGGKGGRKLEGGRKGRKEDRTRVVTVAVIDRYSFHASAFSRDGKSRGRQCQSVEEIAVFQRNATMSSLAEEAGGCCW